MKKNDPRMKARQLFRPKRPELKESCASCPFRKDNPKEFGEIVQRLADVKGVENPSVNIARALIRSEATRSGDFICHGTAYNKDMTLKDPADHRQCPGATKWFKEHPPVDLMSRIEEE